MPSLKTKPAASSKSCPGVRMVTASVCAFVERRAELERLLVTTVSCARRLAPRIEHDDARPRRCGPRATGPPARSLRRLVLAILDVDGAEASLDAEVPLRHTVLDRRHHLDDVLSCTCKLSVQPTPQYGQIVSVFVCAVSSHVPPHPHLVLGARTSARRSGRRRCSCRSTRTPSRAAARRIRSRYGRRNRGRLRRSRTCSARRYRRLRRICST